MITPEARWPARPDRLGTPQSRRTCGTAQQRDGPLHQLASRWIAAFFVGIVAADVFISVLLRYFFSIQIPDAYDFGQLLLGILIFWGIAATSYRGTHITVDLRLGQCRAASWQRVIDVFATLVLLFVVTVQTYTLFDKVVEHLCTTTS